MRYAHTVNTEGLKAGSVYALNRKYALNNQSLWYTAYTCTNDLIPNECSTIKIFLFVVRAACELRSASFDPKHACSGFPVCRFVRNYMHNLVAKGGIKALYLTNDCSNIKDIYSFG